MASGGASDVLSKTGNLIVRIIPLHYSDSWGSLKVRPSRQERKRISRPSSKVTFEGGVFYVSVSSLLVFA